MASIVLRGPTNKRRKNRINSEKLFEFENFAIPDSMAKALCGAFRDNIRVFLDNFAEKEEYTVQHMSVWSTSLFSQSDGVFTLYTVEDVTGNTPNFFCELCASSGVLDSIIFVTVMLFCCSDFLAEFEFEVIFF